MNGSVCKSMSDCSLFFGSILRFTAGMGFLKVFSIVVPVLAVLGTVGLSPGINWVGIWWE